MVTVQRVCGLALRGILRALAALPVLAALGALAAPTTSLALAAPPPTATATATVAASAPAAGAPAGQSLPGTGESDVQKALDRIDERMSARIEECRQRDFATMWGEGKKLVGTAIQEIESDLVNLLKRHPGDGRVVRELGKLYGDWCVEPEPSPAALKLLAEAPDPVGLALDLRRSGGSYTTASTDIVLAALALRPDSAALWLEAANAVERADWKIALTAQGVRCLLPPEGAAPAGDRTRLAAAASAAEQELVLEITWGLLDRAATRLAELPAAVRAIILGGEAGEAAAVIDGVRLEGELSDIRLDLALLRLVHGDAAGAVPLVAGGKPAGTPPPASATGDDELPAGSWSPYSRTHVISGSLDTPQELRLQWAWFRLLQAWLQPPQEDPFDLLVAGIRATSSSYGHRLAAVEVARRERYPALAAHLERELADDLRNEVARGVLQGDPDSPAPTAPAPVAAEITALHAELAALAARMEASARRDQQEARAALGPDPAATIVARQLRAPLLHVYTEHPLPRGVSPLGEAEMDRRRTAAIRELKLPAGFEVVRAEHRGKSAVVLRRSLAYGAPAIWVILSSDGGATWSRPYYTGLRPTSPYTVRAASNLPLLAGDRLQIEVEREGEAASPPRPGSPPAIAHRYLEMPLAAIERDSDGDGLTDLAEERLLTDPLDADTDHDGTPDGNDLLPQIVPAAGSAAGRAAAALLEFEWQWLGDSEAGDQAAASTEPDQGSQGSQGPIGDETDFLAADRQLFAGVRPHHRLVVLTPEEMDQAEEKLGPYRHFTLDLFMVDRAGHRAYVAWTWWAEGSAFEGGVVRLEETEGRWRVKHHDHWTT